MAFYLNENVYTHTFTPREYQVDLVESVKKENTIVCSNTSVSNKTFIIIKTLQEFAWQMKAEGKRALFLLDVQNVSLMKSQIQMLTVLLSVTFTNVNELNENNWDDHSNNNDVILITAEVCKQLLNKNILRLDKFLVLIIDDFLYGSHQNIVNELMFNYKQLINRPRILGLALNLLGPELKPDCLESELQRLESLLQSKIDTSSEIVTLIRLSCRPKEHIIECKKLEYDELYFCVKNEIELAQKYLRDHIFDPSEIYDGELLEEIRNSPHPTDEPLMLLDTLTNILEDMGVWSADQAAFSILRKIEKSKIKTPYERHFLMLCMTSTVLVKIRAICDYAWKDLSDVEKVRQYSSDKILKLLEILKQFKPAGEKPKPPTNVSENVPKEAEGPNSRNRKGNRVPRKLHVPKLNEESLCCLIFVKDRYRAKALFSILVVISQQDDAYWWVSALYSVEKTANPTIEPKEAETEHKLQEDVLRKYRSHECNIMISTSILEDGCDLPKCNLVIRFDLPITFHSYIQSKARSRASDAQFLLFSNELETENFIGKLAEYNEVENILLKRCHSLEPDEEEEALANHISSFCVPYQPLKEEGSPSVSLSTAIALINRYCAKLPSDTFTRLTPIWQEEEIDGKFICNLRLPINSPVKKTIVSPPMPNCLLARRAAAFLTCQLLHKTGELDNNLLPIGKEHFVANEDDQKILTLEDSDEETGPNMEPRPGTTKRRQYYYKKIAAPLTFCHPIVGEEAYFYKIVMTLSCPLPEEQNTRGRKIYPPEDSPQSFGILTFKKIPKVCAFPIFTRSGEVQVNLELSKQRVVLTSENILKIREFLNYTFTSVLRLQKYLMLFNPDASINNYLVVPTCDDQEGNTMVDWNFIDIIYDNLDVLPLTVPIESRKNFQFDPEHYRDSVVMPWYRNQDQPQYFYVAEICNNLNPKSSFPGSEYSTFEEYYFKKYGIQIQNLSQQLLDVDHTSARLNFLTPRYVNRKGVALPTSSEETKRAKRENLEQKQILVPELCAIHPFSASLWRKAVCLPCILYRINALLLADQIRRTVAMELGLGQLDLDDDFKWPPLNFGWSLSDVLKKSSQEEEKKRSEKVTDLENEADEKPPLPVSLTEKQEEVTKEVDDTALDEEIEIICTKGAKINDRNANSGENWDIGTWSNEMADRNGNSEDQSNIRYASPTNWMIPNDYEDFSDSESSYSYDESESDIGGCRIEFTGNFLAEAFDSDDQDKDQYDFLDQQNVWDNINYNSDNMNQLRDEFYVACAKNKQHILDSGVLIKKDEIFVRSHSKKTSPKKILNGTFPDFDFNALNVEPIAAKLSPGKQNLSNNCTLDLNFSFDAQPPLNQHPGPSPFVLLQALTMSNANDGINLERLETIGDSFLKYAITNYLYSRYENVHEGKLSHLRSKQVSNLNLYRLGKRKNLGEYMIATKFDPHDNWLPPCFYVPKELEEALFSAQYPANCWTVADMAATRSMTIKDICNLVKEKGESADFPSLIPYNLVTQHSIPDKSIADCVEALIGAYLIECGPRGALLFMAWLGIKVLPYENGSYGDIPLPHSPLLRHISDPEMELNILLDGYEKFEEHIGYRFNDRSYLLQALTHASYTPNKVTDCYQRLEFLGDAILDYLITRHLYEDSRMHSPGALTDLRSALVNNTIFASLAVRNGFHKYFKHLSPGLNEVMEKFIKLQEDSAHNYVEELYLVVETLGDSEEVEDVEVPKALGDVFESVAGAIFLDSSMSLDAVWKVYYQMMRSEIEQFSNKVPKSPIRELLELEPETAKFGKPEKLADGRRVRVAVEIFGKGLFKGIGRNYRIAKCTAAKCALKHLKRRGLIKRSE